MTLRITPSVSNLFSRLSSPEQVQPVATTAGSADSAPVQVTARLESTVDGLCPYCHQEMIRSSVDAGPVWMCRKDRHVVPLMDPHP